MRKIKGERKRTHRYNHKLIYPKKKKWRKTVVCSIEYLRLVT